MEKNAWLSRLADAQRGDLTAQEHLILCYQQRIAGFVYSFVGESSAVEDLAQQVFLRMLRGLPRLKDPERFEVWLFRLARNVCLNHLRAQKWRRRFVPFAPQHEPAAPEPYDGADEARLAWLRAAVRALPAPQRELVSLLQDGIFSYEELARITGSTVGAVKSRLFRAREQLKLRRERDFSGRLESP